MPVPKQFEQACDILKRMELNGHKAYFVGGCLRDWLLGRPIGDIDIATSAHPQTVQQMFEKVIPVGLQHGTVIVRYDQQSYEVTTFRVEDDYSDQRHPDAVQFVQTIDQDLQRRDFTINALAMNRHGIMIDPFNGKEDLEKGLICTVGNSYERFREDPLRILRALRFSSQLGFQIEEATLTAMNTLNAGIATIAVERIAQETAKFFEGQYINTGMHYFKTIALSGYLPILKDYPAITGRIPQHMKSLKSFGAVIALFHWIEPAIPIQEWVKQWKCSNQIKHDASALAEALSYYHSKGLDHWLVYSLDANVYSDFCRLVNILLTEDLSAYAVRQIEASLPIHSKKDLEIDGTELRRVFPAYEPGRWIGRTLDQLEKQVVTGQLANRQETLKEWLKCNPPVIT
ncbi:CCA tRNA nucleotidyltransferase [Barrientosiimonas marina]|uniref:CCA-adding enzyme n=1 Tax=Lentibacillus kimchii TaxID=1542911 RepID=A0ABW2V098_9BACI